MPTPQAKSDWRSLSTGQIIDLMGAAKVQIAKLEATAKAMSAELLTRGVEHEVGQFFQADRIDSYVQWQINKVAIERDHGADFVVKYSKQVVVGAYIKVKAQDSAAAAMVQMAAE